MPAPVQPTPFQQLRRAEALGIPLDHDIDGDALREPVHELVKHFAVFVIAAAANEHPHACSPNEVTRSAPECARILQQRGLKVSYDTIARWARRGEWRKRVEQLRAVTDVGNPKNVAAALKLQADELTPDLLQGLQLRMIVRMAEQIKELPLTSPDDFDQMVDVLDKLDAIIHRHRGTAIGGNGERKSPISLEAFRANQQDQKDNDPTSA